MEVPRPNDLKTAHLENKLSIIVVGICRPSIQAGRELIRMMADLSDLKCPVALDGPKTEDEQYQWVSDKYKAAASGASWYLIDADGKIIASGVSSPVTALKRLTSQAGEAKETAAPKTEKAAK